MTPDRCRGSFHLQSGRRLAAPRPGSGKEKGAGKIRPNTAIISHSPFQVNGKTRGKMENLCSAQKQMYAFGKHSILKS